MKKIVLLLVYLSFIICCERDKNNADSTTVAFLKVESIGYVSAVCNTLFLIDKSFSIVEKSVCWSQSGLPTINDSVSIMKYCYSDTACFIFMPNLNSIVSV
jgi:hypothetical protein